MKTRLSTFPFPQSDTAELVHIWSELQTLLKGIKRWKRFKGLGMKVRQQDLVQHSLSMTLLGASLVEKAQSDLPTTLVIHDVGEAILGRDVSVTLKGVAHDVAEYEAFRRFTRKLPMDLCLFYRKAFLLQFALDEEKWPHFDSSAQDLLRHLSAERHYEAVMFMVTEHYDYLMFMLEHHKAGNAYLLYEAMQTEVPVWPRLKQLLPAFGTIIFPQHVEDWFMEFRRKYEAAGCETRHTPELVLAREAKRSGRV